MPVNTTWFTPGRSDTEAGWSDSHETAESAESPLPVNTCSSHFEHIEADIQRLGISKDRYRDRTGSAFRQKLATDIRVSGSPDRLIDLVVQHCCLRPNQFKIEDGADALSRAPVQLCNFIEKNFDSYRGSDIVWVNRVWLYTTALSWSSDEETRTRRIRLVETWLWDKDSAVREMAAHALGEMNAVEAREALRAALGREHVSSVREVLSTAVEDIGESA